MKDKIIEIAQSEKISDIGFCGVGDYENAQKSITKNSVMSRESKKADEIIKGAKTIIVCAFNHFNGEKRGNISRYAQGEDYHKVAIRKMSKIVEHLEGCGFKAAMFADTGYLNERLLAQKSGIAFMGRNQMAISEKLGSYFFVGYIVTDCEIEPNRESVKKCIGCNRCVEICPLGALDNNFCEEKCVSYITQKKGELTNEEKNALRSANTIWGCDLCQEVCPHNRNLNITDIDEFRTDLIIDLDFEEMSNKEFKKKYENRAFSWRGKAVLERNLKIFEKK